MVEVVLEVIVVALVAAVSVESGGTCGRCCGSGGVKRATKKDYRDNSQSHLHFDSQKRLHLKHEALPVLLLHVETVLWRCLVAIRSCRIKCFAVHAPEWDES